ncbi:hypothetical protein ACHAXT_005124 [Thalassiosira profunda]
MKLALLPPPWPWPAASTPSSLSSTAERACPKCTEGYFDEQIAKQASTAISKAISAGKKNIEVQFPPVPNVEEAKFGTPLNQRFGKALVAKDLKIKGGYQPGSNASRNLIAYSNIYWAKRLAGALKGSPVGGRPVGVLSAEQVNFDEIGSLGDLSRSGKLNTDKARKEGRGNEAIIAVNPGGEETWDRLVSAHGQPNSPGFEEAYYLKTDIARLCVSCVSRALAGAVGESPDGNVEVLASYKTKPSLREVSEIVREESFKRYAINNDRWMSGRM